MSDYKSYMDLQLEIDMFEVRIKDMEREREFLRRSMYDNAPVFNGVASYEGDRVSGGPIPLPLDKILERLNKIDDSLAVLYEILREKKNSKQKIEQIITQIEGIDYKVAYMRDTLKMKLHEIADELGYSHDHIRRISSKMGRMPHKKPQKTS